MIKRLRTLVVNRSDTYCGECHGNILDLYTVQRCRHCGAEFEYIASDYYGLDSIAKETRPDLTWSEAEP